VRESLRLDFENKQIETKYYSLWKTQNFNS